MRPLHQPLPDAVASVHLLHRQVKEQLVLCERNVRALLPNCETRMDGHAHMRMDGHAYMRMDGHAHMRDIGATGPPMSLF